MKATVACCSVVIPAVGSHPIRIPPHDCHTTFPFNTRCGESLCRPVSGYEFRHDRDNAFGAIVPIDEFHHRFCRRNTMTSLPRPATSISIIIIVTRRYFVVISPSDRGSQITPHTVSVFVP